MQDSVKSLIDVTEDNTDFLPIAYSFAENLVDVKQLVSGGFGRNEFRLKGCLKIILTDIVVEVFVIAAFHCLSHAA